MSYNEIAKEIVGFIKESPTHKHLMEHGYHGREHRITTIFNALMYAFDGSQDSVIRYQAYDCEEFNIASEIARIVIKNAAMDLDPKTLLEEIVFELKKIGINVSGVLKIRYRHSLGEITKIANYSTLGVMYKNIQRREKYKEENRSPIEKKLDRIIELLEQKKEPKEKESYDPKKHSELKDFIKQRHAERGEPISDEKAEHLAKIVEGIRESYNDFLGLKRYGLRSEK